MREVDTPESCNCEFQCFGEPGCVCIYVYDLEICLVDCGGGSSRTGATGGAVFRRGSKLPIDSKVNVCANKVPLGRFGEILGHICAAELAIPAAQAGQLVSLSTKKTTLAEVIKKAGMVVLKDEPTSRHSKR